jgi:hypothetical protein
MMYEYCFSCLARMFAERWASLATQHIYSTVARRTAKIVTADELQRVNETNLLSEFATREEAISEVGTQARQSARARCANVLEAGVPGARVRAAELVRASARNVPGGDRECGAWCGCSDTGCRRWNLEAGGLSRCGRLRRRDRWRTFPKPRSSVRAPSLARPRRWSRGSKRMSGFTSPLASWSQARPCGLSLMVEAADRDRYVTVLQRTLRRGGQVILATFGHHGPTACSGLPVARYGADELSRILGPDFGLVSSRLDEHHTPSGRAQQFLYAHLREEAV